MRARQVRRSSWHRWLIAAVSAAVVAAAAGLGFAYYVARRAEPPYAGAVRLPGLGAPVVVTFGPHAVPHVKAATAEDALFAQGYLVARERLWQMDVARRLARGRLAEVLGPEALPLDRLFRTLGIGAAAEGQVAAIGEDVRRLGDAYVRGVNAYIAGAGGRLPAEYLIAGFEPAPWELVDSCAIGEFVSFALSTNLREELVFLRLARRLGARKAAELFPMEEGVPAPLDEVADLPELAAAAGDPLASYDRLAHRFGLPQLGAVSNNWAVTGARTTSGAAVVCNDPHLPPVMPSIWYEQELDAPGLHVQGVSVPGVPLVLIGHNAHVGWGLTTVVADTQDIVLERIDPSGNAVERPGGIREPIRTEEQRIPVKGRDPYVFTIRRTSAGVLLNDVTGRQPGSPYDLLEVPATHGLALRSNFRIPDRAFEGAYRLSQATTGEDVRRAAVLFAHAAQNFVFAAGDGGIGWQVSGRLPQRTVGSGKFPVPGWTGGHGWGGFLPPERNPGSSAPDDGIIVTANNRTVALDAPVSVSRSWAPPYRAMRIRERLTAQSTLSEDELAAIQLDQTSVEARRYLEAIGRLDLSGHAEAAAVARRLLDWDASFPAASAEAALFVLFRPALFEALFGDELGEDLAAYALITPPHYNALQEAVLTGRSSFWDDVTTPETETAADIWARALVEAQRRLDARGPDTTLGDVHRLVFPHAFHGLKLLGMLFDVGPVGIGGDNFTINMATTRIMQPEHVVYIPSYRTTMTPGAWERTRGTNTLGQSGHRLSPYRTDQLDDWLSGRTHPWHWGGPPAGEVAGVLTLQPAE